MAAELQIVRIEELVNKVLLINEPDFFLVQVKIKPTSNVKVFIDGDKGLTIEKCVQFNRRLYKIIEEDGLFPQGDFSLEVSSAGLDEPLILHRQYDKNIGRKVSVVFKDGVSKEGKLIQVTDTDIILEYEEGKGKKATAQQAIIPFNNIQTTTVQIQF